jgi:hypothetical protein
LVDESFDDYSPNYSLVKTTVFPTFALEVNVIGGGRAILEENPETNNLYAVTYGFSQGYISEPISQPYTYSMDVLHMTGGHAAVMFLRAEKTPAAFYESAQCSEAGYAAACCRNGITLNLNDENTLDVTIIKQDITDPTKPISKWASFNIPNKQEGKTSIKVVDNESRIDIYVNGEILCYIELTGTGLKCPDMNVDKICYRNVSVYHADGKKALSVNTPLVVMKEHYVGWATRMCTLKFDNLFFAFGDGSEKPEQESSIPEESSIAPDQSNDLQSEEASTSSSAVEPEQDADSPITIICIIIMILSVVTSIVVIVIRTKKLQGTE